MFRQIREFTAACNDDVPQRPRELGVAEVHFCARMVLDELHELMLTVHDEGDALLELRALCGGVKRRPSMTHLTGVARIAEQADALVDACYYIGDVAARSGIALDPVFDAVHAANMAKVVDGKVLRNDEGKILKPPGWAPPDVEAVITKQM